MVSLNETFAVITDESDLEKFNPENYTAHETSQGVLGYLWKVKKNQVKCLYCTSSHGQ